MAKPKKAETIANSDFPLYSVRMVGNKHFLVAGGGGQAKTGISNAFVSICARNKWQTDTRAKVKIEPETLNI